MKTEENTINTRINTSKSHTDVLSNTNTVCFEMSPGKNIGIVHLYTRWTSIHNSVAKKTRDIMFGIMYVWRKTEISNSAT